MHQLIDFPEGKIFLKGDSEIGSITKRVGRLVREFPVLTAGSRLVPGGLLFYVNGPEDTLMQLQNERRGLLKDFKINPSLN